jgi:hypothetical protein
VATVKRAPSHLSQSAASCAQKVEQRSYALRTITRNWLDG